MKTSVTAAIVARSLSTMLLASCATYTGQTNDPNS